MMETVLFAIAALSCVAMFALHRRRPAVMRAGPVATRVRARRHAR